MGESQGQVAPSHSKTRILGVLVILAVVGVGAVWTMNNPATIWSGSGIIEETAWFEADNKPFKSFDQCMVLAKLQTNKELCYCAKLAVKGDDALFHAKMTTMLECTKDAQELSYDMDSRDDCERDATGRSEHDACGPKDEAAKRKVYDDCFQKECPGWD